MINAQLTNYKLVTENMVILYINYIFCRKRDNYFTLERSHKHRAKCVL